MSARRRCRCARRKGLRVRLPLRTLTVATPAAAALAPFADLVADEVNVKEVVFTDDVAGALRAGADGGAAGARPPPRRPGAAGHQGGEGGRLDAGRRPPGRRRGALEEGEYELRLVAADAEHSAPLPGGEGVVVLDTEVTPELAAEGLARDVIRVVQQARREAGLDVSDRITLVVDAPPRSAAAAQTHRASSPRRRWPRRSSSAPPATPAFAGEAGEGETVRVAVTHGKT